MRMGRARGQAVEAAMSCLESTSAETDDDEKNGTDSDGKQEGTSGSR